MKSNFLMTYKNLYANFISFVSGKGNEVVMEYRRSTGTYKVTKLSAWAVVYEDHFSCPVLAKNAFRNQTQKAA